MMPIQELFEIGNLHPDNCGSYLGDDSPVMEENEVKWGSLW
jgi:hypothetical protein